jgi:16S rRNA processing protein RimM
MVWSEMVTVGRIVRPHGNKGEVVVESDTDFGADRFQPGATVFSLRDGRVEPLRVRASRPYGERWVVGFDGSGTIDAAETLRGLVLAVPPEALRALAPGRYYVHELMGCRVETESGRAVGMVVRVDFGGASPLLVVESSRGEIWIPLAEPICRKVDLAGKVIVIAPPEGLLDLNVGSDPAR